MLMAPATSAWTLADLDRLPEDGNTYELIDGELFVTPAPSPAHERLITVLHGILWPFVKAEHLGDIYRPHAVVQARATQVEPDLMVLPPIAPLPEKWTDMPTPTLVVEVLSRATRTRDLGKKRNFYVRHGVAEYWTVNRWDRSIRVIRRDSADLLTVSVLEWHPNGAQKALLIDVAAYFAEALGDDATQNDI